jgi:hypothetical protein
VAGIVKRAFTWQGTNRCVAATLSNSPQILYTTLRLAVYAGTWRYLLGRGGLGGVRQETDADGNVLVTRNFDPYGVVMLGDGGSPFRYTGEE